MLCSWLLGASLFGFGASLVGGDIENAKAIRQLELVMPALKGSFAEIREDLKKSPLKREFIIMGKNAMYNSGGEKILAYFHEDHEDLSDKVVVLANSGAVTDITYNNVDRYLMSEELVKYLFESEADAA